MYWDVITCHFWSSVLQNGKMTVIVGWRRSVCLPVCPSRYFSTWMAESKLCGLSSTTPITQKNLKVQSVSPIRSWLTFHCIIITSISTGWSSPLKFIHSTIFPLPFLGFLTLDCEQTAPLESLCCTSVCSSRPFCSGTVGGI